LAAANAREIAADAQKDLDEALPALDAAVSSLKPLRHREVKSMTNPPRASRYRGGDAPAF
jgi:dynein heavy chain